ncbi:MAG: hypothetical protein KQI78_18940 [Deltaproteobacteria bacterium]|nr:hypothetical protein [Deltaproteobacteria bacterium]
MSRILLVVDQMDTFEELADALHQGGGAEILWAHDSESAFDQVADNPPDLVVVDETIGETSGLDWIRRLMGVNAFIHTAAVSGLPHEEFHETSEGLGIMDQLQPRPGKTDAQRLLNTLRQFG